MLFFLLRYDGDLFDVSHTMSGRVFSTSDNDLSDNDCPASNSAGWWFDATTCWNGGMCLTCTQRHYFNGRGDEQDSLSYDQYSYMEMAIKSYNF